MLVKFYATATCMSNFSKDNKSLCVETKLKNMLEQSISVKYMYTDKSDFCTQAQTSNSMIQAFDGSTVLNSSFIEHKFEVRSN